MNLSKVYLSTLLTELPTIINYNNDEFKRYLDLFYNETGGIIIVPVTTTGRVKGATGEFVNIIVDNLTVKNQYTNMYDNNTTADYNWYRMIVDPVFVPRDPCTAATWWPKENYAGYKVIDVNKPYYKIDNSTGIFLANNNLSQVVGIYFDSSVSGDPFTILMNPSTLETYTLDASASGSYMEFICTYFDVSMGSFWERYKYGVESGGGSSGGGGVGPGTINTLAMFTSGTAVGDSPLRINGTLLEGNLDVSVGDIIIHNAIRDSSENILLGYGSPMQLNDPASGREVSIYGPVNIIGELRTEDVSTTGDMNLTGIFNVDGSIILNGTELGPVIYNPILSDSLAMPQDVGGILAGTTVGDLRGKTIEQIINDLLFPTVLASIFAMNSASLAGVSTTTVEAGLTYTPTLTASYDQGLIQNGDLTAGPPLTGLGNTYIFKMPNGATDATIVFAGNNPPAHLYTTPRTLGIETIGWSVEALYDASDSTYYDNKGNAGTNLDGSRVAGSVNGYSGTLTGRRYFWYGMGNFGTEPTNSAGVRALSDKTFLSASNTTITPVNIVIPAFTQEVYFFVPFGKTAAVLLVSTNVDVTGSFIKTTVAGGVNDAGGSAQAYESYVGAIGVSGYPNPEVYRVTIT